MTSQAPDAGTSVTKSVAAAATNAGGANAEGTTAGDYKDEVTGEMVSKKWDTYPSSLNASKFRKLIRREI